MSGDSPAAVVTHHRDGFRSGVARFNELLAARLSVPLVALDTVPATAPGVLLLSFKVSELDGEGAAVADTLMRGGATFDLFLHERSGLPLEEALLAAARRVLCGNAEIAESVGAVRPDAATLWAPGLLLDNRPLPQVDLSVFSFGMAHKLRLDMFRHLRGLLDASGRRYAVYVSAANHETSSMADAADVFAELHAIFPAELYFLGNLSDVAVVDWLRRATFSAAFFQNGARANNTSVVAALEHGAAVITNLDRHSPPWLRHLDTVLDVGRLERLPDDPDQLEALRTRGSEVARGLGWDALAAAVAGSPGARVTASPATVAP